MNCPRCGWKGEEHELEAEETELLDVGQRGYYQIGTPMTSFTYRRMLCPSCHQALQRVEMLHGAEVSRESLSEGGPEASCDECGWKGKEVELIMADGEVSSEDALFRFTYRGSGLGYRHYLCPSCHKRISRKTALYGLDRF